MEKNTCDCCGERFGFRWCDTHGIGACITCGLPYVIYHYDGPQGEQKRVEKPPECALNENGLEIAKRYWTETHRRVFPAYYDMGILGGRETSYSGATEDDCRVFIEWYAKEYPKPAEAAA